MIDYTTEFANFKLITGLSIKTSGTFMNLDLVFNFA